MTAPLAGIIAGIVIISIILVVLIYYYCKRRQARPVPDFLEVKVSISGEPSSSFYGYQKGWMAQQWVL
jgi:hypothetical protein